MVKDTRRNVMRMGLALLAVSAAAAAAVGPGVARQLSNEIADAVEKVMPSVVVIRTEAVVIRRARDIFFGYIYGVPEKLAGQGSGVIVRRDGYVLTSNHVITPAEKIEVVLNDGRKYPAEVVGRDPQTDLAVLKIKAPPGTEFPAAPVGDSDKLRVGEFVIAIGSPFSLESSVTLGIVSQKGRSIGLLPYEDFIQTDAPINPGNSGGPLIDVDGRVVGINSLIQTAGPYSQGNIGIGFAVPINLAMSVADSIIRYGKVERPWIGILPEEIDAAIVHGVLGGERGVLVARVLPGTPAEKCGLKEGDVIVRVDGKPVGSVRALQRAILEHAVGDEVTLVVRRGDQEKKLRARTAPMPDFRSRR